MAWQRVLRALEDQFTAGGINLTHTRLRALVNSTWTRTRDWTAEPKSQRAKELLSSWAAEPLSGSVEALLKPCLGYYTWVGWPLVISQMPSYRKLTRVKIEAISPLALSRTSPMLSLELGQQCYKPFTSPINVQISKVIYSRQLAVVGGPAEGNARPQLQLIKQLKCD